MRMFLVAALLAGVSSVASAGVVYQLDMVNTGSSDIVALEAAMPGTNRFHSVLPAHQRWAATGGTMTVTIRRGDEDGCLRDLRIGFADGRTRIVRRFDICRGRTAP